MVLVNLPYLLPRLVRHFMTVKLVRTLLLRNIIIRPGLETSNPFTAVQRYVDILSARGLSFQNKRVLVFGYGGRFDIGFGLLKEGAEHIILCDKYAPPDEPHNRRLFGTEDKYFFAETRGLRPRSKWMTLLEEDIRELQSRDAIKPVDIVLSSSVYEHLDDVEGITSALATLTKPDGLHIHFVDLRDHFFKYPFEMLRFSESTWRTWLNPSSHHNRYRLWDYRHAFESCFAIVEIEILTREDDAFRKLLPHIKPEFISGNMDEDAAATIRVIASGVKRPAG
ncbi:MAG TPA: methyltransferase domain-containing protein [Anaerolineales bacterium]|nr:methyltransferase domain-containing protein [Anaerolineales bacterium]